MNRTLILYDYSGADDRQRIQAMLDDAGKEPGTVVIIPPGRYVLSTPIARETMRACIAGEYGDNPEEVMFSRNYAFSVGISLSGHNGTTLLGYGAEIMIDGFMEPLAITDSTGIKIRGITIDYLRKPYSKGTVTHWHRENDEAHTGTIEVSFGDKFPVSEKIPCPRFDVYDERSGYYEMGMRMTGRKMISEQTFRFDLKRMPETDLTHQEFYAWHTFHYRPAILIENSCDVTLEEVNIHSQPGMGIVGHRSCDILLKRIKVVPSHGEHMSVNTDATHFTSCKGYVSFEDCEFSCHGDDVTNVHTFYHDFSVIADRTVQGRVTVPTHSLTLDYPECGDTLELVEKQTLNVLKSFRVLECVPDHENMTYRAKLDTEVTDQEAERCFLLNRYQVPYLKFTGCHTSNHWARAVLVKTRKALVENNVFETSALQAIHVAAEGSWHEGGPCEDIVIRGNHFVHTGVMSHPQAGGITIEMSCDRPLGTQQKNILIEDNRFYMQGVRHAISVSNAENVTIHRNTYEGCIEPVHITDCENVTVQDV